MKDSTIAVLVLVAWVLGIFVGGILFKTSAPVQVFEKDYMVTSYPIAGEQGHLYVIDFQFSDLQEVVDWIKQYESIRRKEDAKIRN